jgi:RimJ/RimL family protein N-acetyltransferase
MKHTFSAEGFGVRIRPVRFADAAFIVWLRNLDHARGRVGDSATDVPAQEAWLATYFRRDQDYYFVTETISGIPLGTHGVYHVRNGSAESGRFIVRPDVSAALPTSVLSFDLAFGEMKLSELRASSVVTNHSLHSYVKKLGFKEVATERRYSNIGGASVELLNFTLSPKAWYAARERVLPLARFAETQIQQWETMLKNDNATELS